MKKGRRYFCCVVKVILKSKYIEVCRCSCIYLMTWCFMVILLCMLFSCCSFSLSLIAFKKEKQNTMWKIKSLISTLNINEKLPKIINEIKSKTVTKKWRKKKIKGGRKKKKVPKGNWKVYDFCVSKFSFLNEHSLP